MLFFTNIHKQLKAPFVCYADFECALNPTAASDVKTGIAATLDATLPRKAQREARKEVKYQQPEAVPYAYKIVSINPNVNKQEIDNASECHICNEAFKDGEKKVRDHFHSMGTFHDAAHNRCNLIYKIYTRR